SMLVENVTPYNRLFDGSLVPDVWRPESLAGLAALDAEINRQAATISYVN
ncbi:MAG: hypothetical protein GWN83_01540, partial [Gemmatimonadetes bacterium]|nr:hypothetical protein [Gemmatimonadota bacterium]